MTYRYEVRQDGVFVGGGDVASTSASQAGLSADTTYSITVAALTDAGVGPLSTPVSGTTDPGNRSSVYRVKWVSSQDVKLLAAIVMNLF